MSGLLDVEAIRRDNPLPSIVGASLKLLRAGGEWKACCPFHDDRSPSFTIFADGKRFKCFGCGASGDVLDYIRRSHRVSLREAADMLRGGNCPSSVTTTVTTSSPADQRDRREQALAIWRGAAPASGTAAETYLRARGLTLPVPPTIRFAQLRYGQSGARHPCLVACIASVEQRFIGVQRTYLRADGSGKAAVPKPKLSLGRVSGGAIRCAPVAAELIVTEGLEDGLTLQQELGVPVWVAAGASMLPAMRFPPSVRSIVIGADGDAAGDAAARKAADTFRARGLAVRIMRPASERKDFNEMLREERAA